MDPYYSAQRPLAPIQPAAPDLIPSRPDDSNSQASVLENLPTDRATGRQQQQQQQQKRKHKRIACKECRQAKVRCDGLNSCGTNACVRCQRFGLQCYIETNYKRVNRRVKIDQLVQQVEQLRSAVGYGIAHDLVMTEADDSNLANTSQDTPPNHKKQNSLPQSSLQSTTYDSSRRSDHSRDNGAFDFDSQKISQEDNLSPEDCSLTQCSPMLRSVGSVPTASSQNDGVHCLEDIELNSQHISSLFNIFFEHYHHFLEILDPSLSPDQYYNRSPLLFWCIVSVAARRYEDDATLLATLSPCVTKLIWSTILVLPQSRFTVQALLLIATWPFPTSSMSTDPSFMLVSIAKSASMQLGLHRPETVQDFLRVKTQFDTEEFKEVVKVWVGCYIGAQSVTSSIGQPSFFRCDWAINRACESGGRYTLPDNLRNHLLIHKYIARVNSAMAENDESPTGYPNQNESCVLLAMLERDLVDLERQISYKLSMTHQILLCMACLQLRIYYFFVTSKAEVRKRGLLKAYATSLTLVSKATDADIKWNFVNYAPNIYSHMLIMAAMMLMKIVNSSYAKYVDVEEGKKAFNSVLAMLKRSSVENNDLRGRASTILAQLWGVHHSLTVRREQEPNINIKTRCGASLLHDLLWMWREEFGGQGVATTRVATSIPLQAKQASTSIAQEVISSMTPNNPNSEDRWNTDTIGPQNEMLQHRTVPLPNDALVQDTDWLWDIGFPSLLPIDLDYDPMTFSPV